MTDFLRSACQNDDSGIDTYLALRLQTLNRISKKSSYFLKEEEDYFMTWKSASRTGLWNEDKQNFKLSLTYGNRISAGEIKNKVG